MKIRTVAPVLAMCLTAILAGCLQVSTTEHRIKLNKDGSGEHMLRLVDIRSDATTDSAVAHDFRAMMTFYDDAAKEFVSRGRTVMEKKLFARHDTLIGELDYTVKELGAIEGLRVTEKELFVVIGPSRVIVKTNGKIRSEESGYQRIVWDRDATRLFYSIREKEMPPTVSLTPMYRGEKR
jgi:hypothetical protein